MTHADGEAELEALKQEERFLLFLRKQMEELQHQYTSPFFFDKKYEISWSFCLRKPPEELHLEALCFCSFFSLSPLKAL